MAVTAKVHCNSKTGDGDYTRLNFIPDYAEGRNKEWAVATPHLSLVMTVNAKAAELFDEGKAYTLTFEPDEG